MSHKTKPTSPSSGDGNTPATGNPAQCGSAPGATPSSSPGSENRPQSPPPIPQYAIRVTATTRAGDIPIQGLVVKVDGATLGTTNKSGEVGPGPLRSISTASLEVIYHNSAEKLKKEIFSLKLTNISAPGETVKVGKGSNCISKIRDVLGTGSRSLSGDLDFSDSYSLDSSQVTWEPHRNGKDKIIHICVNMATISLVVPYLNQNVSDETIEVGPKTTHIFKGYSLCFPTSTTMMLKYWDVSLSDGTAMNRNGLMQHIWDNTTSPSVTYPCPWQIYTDVRSAVGQLVDSTFKAKETIGSSSKDGTNNGMPSTYADEIVARIAVAEPVVIGTDATSGHIMLIRGAVVDHTGKAQYLIFNDPYGSLASSTSIYGTLKLGAAVGLDCSGEKDPINQSEDVEAVQAALTELGYYHGDINGVCDASDEADPTVKAIGVCQGAGGDGRIDPGGSTEKKINTKLKAMHSYSYSPEEGEVNAASGAESDRGRHVYYNSKTEGHTGSLHISSHVATLVRSPTFTKEEIQPRLVLGNGE